MIYYSLGYNCCIKRYLDNSKLTKETNMFDYIGSSMWGICKLLIAIKDEDNIYFDVEKKIVNNKIWQYNPEYSLIFLHDLRINFTNKEVQNMNDKYKRRFYRLKQILNNKNTITFIRLQSPKVSILLYNYDKELPYIIEFINIMRIYFKNIDFKLLYIIYKEYEYDKDLIANYNELIIIKAAIEEINYINAYKTLEPILSPYINSNYQS